MRHLKLQREIAVSEAEEKAFQKLYEEEIVGKENVKFESQDYGILGSTSRFPTFINADIDEERKDSSNLRFETKIDLSAPTPKSKFEEPRPIIHSQTQAIPSNLDTWNETLKQLTTIQGMQTQLSSLIASQQKIQHLPIKEPPLFSGDVFDYSSFITAFDFIISDNVASDKDRLYFLAKYTTGKAHEVIKEFLAVNSENAYREARKLLDRRFGNPVYVAEACKSRLRNWPQIKDGDSANLQAFSDFLIRCQEAAKAVRSIGELDSNQTIFHLAAKLPSYSGVKWCHYAHDKQAKSMSQVKFKDFVNFVREESELANDPIFSPDALRQERKSASREGSSRGRNYGQTKSASFVTGVTQNTASQTQAASYSQLQCLLCERIGHELIKCFEFKKKSLEERRSIVKAKGLCFGCLKLGHFSADCQERLICKECKKSHPTLLHGAKSNKHCTRNSNNVSSNQQAAKQSEGESANVNSTVCRSLDMQSDVTTSMIIPVIVHHKDNPDNIVKTYALLDDGSDSTFITDNLLTMMGLEGTDVSLQLNTMHGKKKICTRRVDGLIIQDIRKGVVINLPKTYSRAAIPSHRHNIPSPEIANKWSHLRRIKHLIPIVENGLSVGLLVGCNCPKALKPREVILGKDEDPYAVRTLLGWGIIGPITP